MTYEQIKDLKPDDFKRACGVHPVFSRQRLSRDKETAQQQPNTAEEATRWRVEQTGEATESGPLEPTRRLRARHREIESIQNPWREV